MLNFFAIAAFALIVIVRYAAEERAYQEACVVTYILVLINLALKLADTGLPLVAAFTCFPSSSVFDFNSTLISANCVQPCVIGDFFAFYALYAYSKAAMGIADVLLSTGFLMRRPWDWYRVGSSAAKIQG